MALHSQMVCVRLVFQDELRSTGSGVRSNSGVRGHGVRGQEYGVRSTGSGLTFDIHHLQEYGVRPCI